MSENQKRKHVMCVAVCVIIVMMLLIISGLALYTSYNAYFEQKGRVRRNVGQSIEIIREVSQETATKLE